MPVGGGGELDEICERWEIIVVDDGLIDRTMDLAEFAARDPRHPAAVPARSSGLRARDPAGVRGGPLHGGRLALDSDGQFDLRDAARLYPFLKDADMVGGFRISREDNWMRRRVSATYNWLQSRILGLDVRDVNCALKLFRSSFLYMIELTSEGFLIDAEI